MNTTTIKDWNETSVVLKVRKQGSLYSGSFNSSSIEHQIISVVSNSNCKFLKRFLRLKFKILSVKSDKQVILYFFYEIFDMKAQFYKLQ